MKKVIFALVLITLILIDCTGAKQTRQTTENLQQDKAVELTFAYTRQSGHASNQFAVWIEDANEKHIKTIYATNFTANGGWRRRPDSIPNWVRKSDISNMTKVQIDSVSGATPRTGAQNFIWDGTDSNGITVPDGDYTLFLEGTLRWENRVIYRVPFQLGEGATLVNINTEYSGNSNLEHSMIDNVMVQVFR